MSLAAFTVLLIHNHPDDLREVTQILQQAFPQLCLRLAHDAESVAQALAEGDVALVVNVAPWQDQRQRRLLEQIRQHAPQTPIFWITPEPPPETEQAALPPGVVAVLAEQDLQQLPELVQQAFAQGERPRPVSSRISRIVREALDHLPSSAAPDQALTSVLEVLTQAAEALLGVLYLEDPHHTEQPWKTWGVLSTVSVPAEALPPPTEAAWYRTVLQTQQPLCRAEVEGPWPEVSAPWGHVMAFPLLLRGQRLGVLILWRNQDQRPFDPETFYAVQEALPALMALALETRLQAREQRLATQVERTRALLRAIHRATFYLGTAISLETLWLALAKGVREMGWSFVAFRVVDKEQLRLHAYNLPGAVAKAFEQEIGIALKQWEFSLHAWPQARKSLLTQQPQIGHARWEDIRQLFPQVEEGALQQLFRALGLEPGSDNFFADLPLWARGRPWGLLVLWGLQLKDSAQEVLETFSREINLALEKTLLLEERTRQAQRNRALAQLSAELVAATDIETLAHTVVEHLQGAFHFPQAAVYRYEADGRLSLVAYSARSPRGIPQRVPATQVAALNANAEATATPVPPSAAILGGPFSEMIFPVRADGRDLGVIIVSHPPAPWGFDDLQLLRTIADVTAVAWLKGQLILQERQQAQAQEALRAILLELSHELDPDRLGTALLDHARTIAGLQGVALWVPSDQQMGWRLHGWRGAFAHGPAVPSTPPQWVEGPPESDQGHHQYFPLIARGKVVGMLEAEWEHPPTPAQRNRLILLTAQAAITLENAHLFAQTRQNAQTLQVLYTASREIASASVEPEAVCQRVHQAVRNLLGGEAFILARYQPGEDRIAVPYAVEDGKRLPVQQLPLDRTSLLGYVITRQRPVLIYDLSREVVQLPFRFRQTGRVMRSILAVPLLRQGRALGAVAIQSRQPYAFTNADLRLLQALASQMAVALENADLYEQMRQLAITDELTGLYNRRHLFALGAREIKRAARFHHPLTAMLLDLDDFKRINDRLGHSVGDEVLRLWARRMTQGIREVDILGRYGGEEFGLFLPETPIDDALLLAKRLHRLVSETPFETSAGPIYLTMSIGLASWQPHIQSPAALLQEADFAQYAAKNAGKNRIAWRDPDTLQIRVETR